LTWYATLGGRRAAWTVLHSSSVKSGVHSTEHHLRR